MVTGFSTALLVRNNGLSNAKASSGSQVPHSDLVPEKSPGKDKSGKTGVILAGIRTVQSVV
jgi:hypothetical protein